MTDRRRSRVDDGRPAPAEGASIDAFERCYRAGCGHDECRRMVNAARRMRMGTAPREPKGRTHGTISSYNAGCHDRCCRQVAAAKQRRVRANRGRMGS